MKILVLFILTRLLIPANDLAGSIWTLKIANGCVNKLTFKSNGKATSYDCELDYTLQCTYKIKKDTLLIIEKDDSHSEDGGHAHFSRTEYLMRNNMLYIIGNGELIKGKWKDVKLTKVNSRWERIK